MRSYGSGADATRDSSEDSELRKTVNIQACASKLSEWAISVAACQTEAALRHKRLRHRRSKVDGGGGLPPRPLIPTSMHTAKGGYEITLQLACVLCPACMQYRHVGQAFMKVARHPCIIESVKRGSCYAYLERCRCDHGNESHDFIYSNTQGRFHNDAELCGTSRDVR